MIPLITIEGPTASGKSILALELARELDSEVISADSRQVYRYLDIGTAKPSTADRKLVSHHLIDTIDPDESYNVGRFCSDASAIIERLHTAGSIPIVCGGTGLYVAGLLNGIFTQMTIPSNIREALTQRLSTDGLSELYAELTDVDPPFASRISSNDKQRILRGLEVYLATGTTLSGHWLAQTSIQRYSAFRILLDPPREQLYKKINMRMENMLNFGLVDEIKNLLDNGYDVAAPGLNSLGYKEFLPYLKDDAPLTDCISLAAQHSRNYAKRQCTWYHKYKFDLTLESNECIISAVIGIIKTRFNGKSN